MKQIQDDNMIDDFLKSDTIPELKDSVNSLFNNTEEKNELELFNNDNEWVRTLAYNKPGTPFLKDLRKFEQKRSHQYRLIRRI